MPPRAQGRTAASGGAPSPDPARHTQSRAQRHRIPCRDSWQAASDRRAYFSDPRRRGGGIRLRQRLRGLLERRPAPLRSILHVQTCRYGAWPRDQRYPHRRARRHTGLSAERSGGRLLHIAPTGGEFRGPDMKQGPIVYIVDDDEAVRNSLRLLVKSVGLTAMALVSAQEFLATHDPLQPGCLVLDVRMPGMSGLELQQQLNRRAAVIR